jgi:hypothetical protein
MDYVWVTQISVATRMAKKTRAPGGGRKPLDQEEAQSVKMMVRVQPKLRAELLALAEKHQPHKQEANLSAEIKRALQHWVRRYEDQRIYNSALGVAVAVLADRIEGITGKRWATDPVTRELADPATRELVRECAVKLVAHILTPLATKRVTIPAELKDDANLILALLVGAMPRPGSARLAGTVVIDDRGLALILQDLARHLGEGSVSVRAVDLAAIKAGRQK